MSLTFYPVVPEVIFRISQIVSVKEKSKYIIIHFSSDKGATGISDKFRKGGKPILVQLKRNPLGDYPVDIFLNKSVASSDRPEEIALPTFRWYDEKESRKICQGKHIPCYEYISEEPTCCFERYHPCFFSHFEGFATHQEVPVYPEKAKKLGIEGKIVVVVLINRKGDVVKTCCEEGNELLKAAARKAAAKWKFRPFRQISILPQCGYVQHSLVFSFQTPEP